MVTKPSLELLTGKVISHAWLGHGSVLFLELGELSAGDVRKDGSKGNGKGEITIFIGYDWRIERKGSILGGSNDSKKRFNSFAKKLVGKTILLASTTGRIPELQLQLSDGLWVGTFSHEKGQPEWDVGFCKPDLGYLCVKRGKLSVEDSK